MRIRKGTIIIIIFIFIFLFLFFRSNSENENLENSEKIFQNEIPNLNILNSRIEKVRNPTRYYSIKRSFWKSNFQEKSRDSFSPFVSHL